MQTRFSFLWILLSIVQAGTSEQGGGDDDAMLDKFTSWSKKRRRLLQNPCGFKIDGCCYAAVDRECVPDLQLPLGVGGVSISGDKYPFMISLQEERRDRGRLISGCYKHVCGASIILDDVVLTAAHCLDKFVDFQLKGQLQSLKTSTRLYAVRESSCRHQQGSEKLVVRYAYVHGDYTGENFTYDNDIALLFLSSKVHNREALINFVNAKQYEYKAYEIGNNAVMIGFGLTTFETEGLFDSFALKEASTRARNKQTCLAFLGLESDGIDWSPLVNNETMICTYNGAADVCRGDSGGPLFVQADSGEYIQLGLVSWGPYGSCETNTQLQSASVFTRISHYIDWILDGIEKYSLSEADDLATLSVFANQTSDLTPTPKLAPAPPPMPKPTAPPPAPIQKVTVADALAELKQQTVLEVWSSEDYCSSTKITCDNDRIVEIDLDYGELAGTLPPEISALVDLKKLSLGFNQLSGPIPAEISGMVNLESFSAWQNDFTGTIPSEMSLLTALTFLSLPDSDLEGTLPPWLSVLTSLENFFIQNNKFIGTLPPQYSTLQNLDYFAVGKNSIVGTLPPQYSVIKKINSFSVGDNLIQGILPSGYSEFSSDTYLSFENNLLTGTVPKQYTKFTATNSLILSGNPSLCILDQENYPEVSPTEVLPCN